MGNYAGANNWVENVYQFDETDMVLGGPAGVDNKPLKNLADRTKYLYERVGLVGRFAGELNITTNTTLDASVYGKVIMANTADSVLSVTLPLLSTLGEGWIIHVCAFESGGVVNVLPQDIDKINDGLDDTVFHLHNKESAMFMKVGGKYKVLFKWGNFDCVGEEVKSRMALNNAVLLDGTLYDRAKKPRLWKLVSGMSDIIVSESTYNSHATKYKGYFTTGNGTTTFRVPDERGMFDRMLDLGRGIDTYRDLFTPGSFQIDSITPHTHETPPYYIPNPGVPERPAKWVVPQMIEINSEFGGDPVKHTKINNNTGNSAPSSFESRPKNIGKLNYIKY